MLLNWKDMEISIFYKTFFPKILDIYKILETSEQLFILFLKMISELKSIGVAISNICI